jgi:hypothetical protein
MDYLLSYLTGRLTLARAFLLEAPTRTSGKHEIIPQEKPLLQEFAFYNSFVFSHLVLHSLVCALP